MRPTPSDKEVGRRFGCHLGNARPGEMRVVDENVPTARETRPTGAEGIPQGQASGRTGMQALKHALGGIEDFAHEGVPLIPAHPSGNGGARPSRVRGCMHGCLYSVHSVGPLTKIPYWLEGLHQRGARILGLPQEGVALVRVGIP